MTDPEPKFLRAGPALLHPVQLSSSKILLRRPEGNSTAPICRQANLCSTTNLIDSTSDSDGKNYKVNLCTAEMNTAGTESDVAIGHLPISALLRLPATLLITASQVYPNPGRKQAKDRLNYIIRGLATARATAAWFQLLQEPGLTAFSRLNPRILSKLQRPYLQTNLQPVARLKLLQEHYRFALSAFAGATFADLLQRPGIVLAEIPIDDVGRFSLRLLYANKYEKEGELTLGLHDGDRREFVFALSFSVTSFTPNPREVFIGGLQGNQIANQRERIVAITRAMHGLRPKALLVFALHELVEFWDISTIRAVGNRNAVFRDPWIGDRGIHANYDQFWFECGGQQDPDGNFTLPARFVPRDLSALMPAKRTLHRRRYEMLAELGVRIRQGAQQISSNAQK
jgi:uncharacterized protein VirK/YbjX